MFFFVAISGLTHLRKPRAIWAQHCSRPPPKPAGAEDQPFDAKSELEYSRIPNMAILIFYNSQHGNSMEKVMEKIRKVFFYHLLSRWFSKLNFGDRRYLILFLEFPVLV
jgi:hypothetical protein